MVVNVEEVEGAVPKLSPEALVVYNKLNAAEKATLLKEIGQKRKEGRREERKRGVCYKPYI